MNRIIKIAATLMAIAILTTVDGRAADQPTPKSVVDTFHAALISSAKAGASWDFTTRTSNLRPVVTQTFNLPLMIRIAAGRAFSKASKADKTDLVTAFSEMTVRTYATQFKADVGQTFQTIGEKPGPQKTILVETTITAKGKNHKLTYVTRKNSKGQWMIMDVLLGDSAISQLSVRRSEYAQTLKTGGVPALITALNATP